MDFSWVSVSFRNAGFEGDEFVQGSGWAPMPNRCQTTSQHVVEGHYLGGHIRAVEDELNSRLRRILRDRTLAQLFAALLAFRDHPGCDDDSKLPVATVQHSRAIDRPLER